MGLGSIALLLEIVGVIVIAVSTLGVYRKKEGDTEYGSWIDEGARRWIHRAGWALLGVGFLLEFIATL